MNRLFSSINQDVFANASPFSRIEDFVLLNLFGSNYFLSRLPNPHRREAAALLLYALPNKICGFDGVHYGYIGGEPFDGIDV